MDIDKEQVTTLCKSVIIAQVTSNLSLLWRL